MTLVERGQVGQEASWAGGGILSPLCSWDYTEPVTQLAHRGMAMFAEWAESLQLTTGIDIEYQHSGMLVLPPFPEAQAQQWSVQHGVALQQVDAANYLPVVQQAALLLPEVAQVRNPRLLRALRKQVEMLGGRILEHCAVQGFNIGDARVLGLKTAQGELIADHYLVTAGAWSQSLLGEYAMHMDVRPIRGQILLFKLEQPPFRQVLLKQDLYVIPRRDGHVLVGSTLEDVGFDKATTQEGREYLMQGIRKIFPDWRHEPINHWAGFRPGSPGNIPVIGRHPAMANLYVNSGHFRYGVTMSFASAEWLLNEITGRPQPWATEAYHWR